MLNDKELRQLVEECISPTFTGKFREKLINQMLSSWTRVSLISNKGRLQVSFYDETDSVQCYEDLGSLRTILQSSLAKLDSVSRDIIQSRWLGPTITSYQELGKKLQLTALEVQELEDQAFQKLKPLLKDFL